jgi:nicotinamide riboside transporter PnuC
MDIAALILSIYSALLATFLGYLAWNREKHRVRAFAQPFMVVE